MALSVLISRVAPRVSFKLSCLANSTFMVSFRDTSSPIALACGSYGKSAQISGMCLWLICQLCFSDDNQMASYAEVHALWLSAPQRGKSYMCRHWSGYSFCFGSITKVSFNLISFLSFCFREYSQRTTMKAIYLCSTPGRVAAREFAQLVNEWEHWPPAHALMIALPWSSLSCIKPKSETHLKAMEANS